MSDRLLMEPTFDMEEEEEEVMEREETEENTNKEQEVNNLDDGEVEACDKVVTVGDQEEFEELELQLEEEMERIIADSKNDQAQPGESEDIETGEAAKLEHFLPNQFNNTAGGKSCLLYTSDAADE